MIYKHKRTGVNYRWLLNSFDVATQKHHVVYMSLKTGEVFNRDEEVFEQNFVLVDACVQSKIQPKEKV